MKKTLLLTALVALSFAFTACEKDDTTPSSPVSTKDTLYIGGIDNFQATYWKADTANNLVLDKAGSVKAMMEYNDELYLVGYSTCSKKVAVYWLNGEINYLSDTTLTSSANDICEYDDDIYIVGKVTEEGNSYTTACYWKKNRQIVGKVTEEGNSYTTACYLKKNGQVLLTDSTSNSEANAIYIDEAGDVYIAGIIGQRATLWVNSDETTLTCDESATYSIATDVAVYDNDVYAVGYQIIDSKFYATYWKNGKPSILGESTTLSYANSILIKDGDIYIAGVSELKAVYWKNKKMVTLSTENALASSMYINGEDIYVCGYTIESLLNMKACYWKNGEQTMLSEKFSQALCILFN